MFCSRAETLREILTQQGILNGMIPLMQHIRASIDLGYRVEPLITVESESDREQSWDGDVVALVLSSK